MGGNFILVRCTKLFLLLGVSILFYNCSVQKRHYQKGYYVSFNKQNKSVNSVEKDIDDELSTSVSVPLSSSKADLPFLIPKAKSLFPKDSCRDMIFYKNGSYINAKVIEVTDKEVNYVICAKNNNKIYTDNKEFISEIKYASGKKSNIEQQLKTEKEFEDEGSSSNGEKPYSAGTIIGTIASLLAMLLLYLVITGSATGLGFMMFFLLLVAILIDLISFIHSLINSNEYKGQILTILMALFCIGGILVLFFL